MTFKNLTILFILFFSSLSNAKTVCPREIPPKGDACKHIAAPINACANYWEISKYGYTYCWNCNICIPYANNCIKNTYGCHACRTVTISRCQQPVVPKARKCETSKKQTCPRILR